MRPWSERIPLILAIVEKDLRVSKAWWIVSSIIGAVGFFFMLPLAMNVAYLNAAYGGRFQWFDTSLRGFYGLTALLTSVALGTAFSHVHSGEIHRGTIRSIILYPVDMNDVTLAKLASSFLLAFFLSGIIFLGFMFPMFAYGALPVLDMLAIFLMTLLMGLLALATGVFLAQAIARVAGRMVVSPATLGSLLLIFALLLTESAVGYIGTYLLSLSHGPGGVSPAEYEAMWNSARGVSVLSPQHMGARILAIAFGLTSMWPDIHVVLPVAAVVLASGYLVGKKLYLDLFMR